MIIQTVIAERLAEGDIICNIGSVNHVARTQIALGNATQIMVEVATLEHSPVSGRTRETFKTLVYRPDDVIVIED